MFPQPSLGGEEWLILIDGGKRENRLDVYGTFERMKVSKDSVGSLKSWETSQTILGLVAQLLINLGAYFKTWYENAPCG